MSPPAKKSRKRGAKVLERELNPNSQKRMDYPDETASETASTSSAADDIAKLNEEDILSSEESDGEVDNETEVEFELDVAPAVKSSKILTEVQIRSAHTKNLLENKFKFEFRNDPFPQLVISKELQSKYFYFIISYIE
jgi:hypothetical protein